MKQSKLFDENLDPEIVKIADRCVELEKEEKASKDKLNIQTKNLIGLMTKANKPRIRHGGYLFEISRSESKEKLKIKAEAKPKKK